MADSGTADAIVANNSSAVTLPNPTLGTQARIDQLGGMIAQSEQLLLAIEDQHAQRLQEILKKIQDVVQKQRAEVAEHEEKIRKMEEDHQREMYERKRKQMDRERELLRERIASLEQPTPVNNEFLPSSINTSTLLDNNSIISLAGNEESAILYPSNSTPAKSPLRQSPLRQSPLRQSPLRQSPLRQSPLRTSVRTDSRASTPQMHTLRTPGPSSISSPGLLDKSLRFDNPTVTLRSLRDKLRDSKEHYDEMKEEMQSSQKDSSLLTHVLLQTEEAVKVASRVLKRRIQQLRGTSDTIDIEADDSCKRSVHKACQQVLVFEKALWIQRHVS